MTVHLDANVLIALLAGNAKGLDPLRRLLRQGAEPATSALAWFEVLCGPSQTPVTPEELDILHAFIAGRIIPIDSSIASLAARLFNQAGRTKGSQADCLVAATAIESNAELFTFNLADFERFVPFGLKLLR